MSQRRRVVYLAVAAMLAVSALSACSSDKGSKNGDSVATNSGSTSTNGGSTSTDQPSGSDAAAAMDPMGKYDTPITLTTVKRTLQNTQYKDGQSLDSNPWMDFLKQQGVNIKYSWTADAGQFENQMNVTIASGDLPDILPQITGSQANTLIKGDQLMDMKPYLDKYLSDEAKKILYGDGGQLMNGTLTSDGKQYLLPLTAAEMRADIKSLWIRKDWLDKLHLEVPKTADEFEKVAEAFTKQDPDGNGKPDTYGFGIAGKGSLLLDWGGADAVFEMFHSQPGPWWDNSLFYEKDDSGKLIWSGSKPGVKQALTLLQNMYKKGELAKDLGTVDAGGKMAQDITASKVGMFIGRWWQAGWPLPDLRTKDPKADWVVASIPSGDGQPVQPYGYRPGNVYMAVSKNNKNPEAVVKIINWYVDKVFGPNADTQNYASIDPKDVGRSTGAAPFVVNDPYKLSRDYMAISAAVKSKDPSKLNAEQKQYYDDEQKFESDPTYVIGWTDWQNYSGAEGTAGKHYWEDVKESDVLKNAFFGVPGEKMVTNVPTYKKMAEEEVTKIIYGQTSVDDWDNLVNSWNKLAGTDILNELQAAGK